MKAEHSRRRDLMKLWKMHYTGEQLDKCAEIAKELDKYSTCRHMHEELRIWADKWDKKVNKNTSMR